MMRTVRGGGGLSRYGVGLSEKKKKHDRPGKNNPIRRDPGHGARHNVKVCYYRSRTAPTGTVQYK